MSSDNRRALEYLEIRGYYSTSYTQIVQPERIFAVTDYFRRYWVPLLKPGPAWLVVALRQRCFWNGQRDWCVVSRQTLAQESGVAIRTADNYLDLPLVKWFVTGRRPRYTRTRDGTKRRDWTHYDLRLDEPLTPAHQAALASIAAEMAAECQAADPAAVALEIAHRLLELSTEELLRRLDETAQTPKYVPIRTGQVQTKATKVGNPPLAVQEIIESAAGLESEIEPGGALSRACDTLYTRIVRPDKVQIATQYFRLRWLPLLGAARAWLILHLRARCYLNTHDLEVRDTCDVAGLAELSGALGVSISTVKTCLAEPPAATFLTHLATHRPGAGRVEMRFRVEMIDPLTPADQQRQGDLTALTDDQQPDFAGSPPDQKPEFATSPPTQKTDFAPHADQRPEFAASSPDQEPDPALIGDPTKGQDLRNTKRLVITSELINTHQHQVLIPPGQEGLPLAVAAGSLSEILATLGIREPTRSRIVGLNPPTAVVLGWALEATSSEGIASKPAFLAAMLTSTYAPPADLVELVRLPVADWLVMAAAARETRTTGQAHVPPRLAPHFEVLYSRFGRLDPTRWPILLPGLAERAGGEEEAEEEQADSPVDDMDGVGEVWGSVLAELRTQMDPSTFNAWLKGSHVIRVDGNHWTVAVRSQTAADWLGHRLLPVIRRTAARIASRQIDIGFEAEG